MVPRKIRSRQTAAAKNESKQLQEGKEQRNYNKADAKSKCETRN